MLLNEQVVCLKPSWWIFATVGSLLMNKCCGASKEKLVYEAMAINVARNIGKEAPVCEGKIDQIILTGGIAYSSSFCDMIVKHVSWIAPVSIIPGENEMSALALGVLRVLRGTEQARIFHEEPEWTLV